MCAVTTITYIMAVLFPFFENVFLIMAMDIATGTQCGVLFMKIVTFITPNLPDLG